MLKAIGVKAIVIGVIAGSAAFLAGCTSQDVAGLYVDAVVLTEMRQTDLAVEKLNTAVKANPRFSPAYSLLGRIYQQDRKYEKSVDAYKKATKINWWSFNDFFNLGKVYQITQRFTEAVEVYVSACRLRPDHLEAHLNTARCYFQLKQYDSALQYGLSARAIDPNAADVQKVIGDIHEAKADIYKAKKDYEQAIASYRQVLEIRRNDPNIMMSLAVAYIRSKHYDPARELLVQVIEAQPDNGRAHQYLGYCRLRFREQYEQLKQKLAELEKAIESYRRAVEINDQDWTAHKGLGVAYMIKVLGEEDDQLRASALEHWKTSLQLKPDQPNNAKLRKLLQVYSR